MEMILLHDLVKREENPEKELHLCCDFTSIFLKKSPPASNFPGKFVLVPDGLHCATCYFVHGYPSHELTNEESEEFLLLLELCPCFCAYIELPRHWLLGFNVLDRKFDTLEALMRNQNLEEKSWKLVRETETIKESYSVGLVFLKLWELPEGILDDCKNFFPEFVSFLYKNRVGFIKGKFLVMSPELLFRYCEGNITMFLNYISQAYSLVQSQYCSISRMAIEGGFWQVCPEIGGFFWQNIVLKKNFPFLKEFLQKKMIFVKNFCLSMGPHHLIGGGYFSYIYNTKGDLVVWYVPNFWQEGYVGFNPKETKNFHNSKHFWYGIEGSKFGCYYNGVSKEVCNDDMLQFVEEYYV